MRRLRVILARDRVRLLRDQSLPPRFDAARVGARIPAGAIGAIRTVRPRSALVEWLDAYPAIDVELADLEPVGLADVVPWRPRSRGRVVDGRVAAVVALGVVTVIAMVVGAAVALVAQSLAGR